MFTFSLLLKSIMFQLIKTLKPKARVSHLYLLSPCKSMAVSNFISGSSIMSTGCKSSTLGTHPPLRLESPGVLSGIREGSPSRVEEDASIRASSRRESSTSSEWGQVSTVKDTSVLFTYFFLHKLHETFGGFFWWFR